MHCRIVGEQRLKTRKVSADEIAEILICSSFLFQVAWVTRLVVKRSAFILITGTIVAIASSIMLQDVIGSGVFFQLDDQGYKEFALDSNRGIEAVSAQAGSFSGSIHIGYLVLTRYFSEIFHCKTYQDVLVFNVVCFCFASAIVFLLSKAIYGFTVMGGITILSPAFLPSICYLGKETLLVMEVAIVFLAISEIQDAMRSGVVAGRPMVCWKHAIPALTSLLSAMVLIGYLRVYMFGLLVIAFILTVTFGLGLRKRFLWTSKVRVRAVSVASLYIILAVALTFVVSGIITRMQGAFSMVQGFSVVNSLIKSVASGSILTADDAMLIYVPGKIVAMLCTVIVIFNWGRFVRLCGHDLLARLMGWFVLCNWMFLAMVPDLNGERQRLLPYFVIYILFLRISSLGKRKNIVSHVVV